MPAKDTLSTVNSPLALYNAEISSGTLSADPAQAQLMLSFQRLYADIVAASTTPAPRSKGVLKRLFAKNPAVSVVAPPLGLYVWGGVGRGKTHLTDLFFESLPMQQKLRLHYHRFMQKVHHQLRDLGDIEEPLERVAESLAAEARVICLDEMHINDITDAMLMHGLLTRLFDRGVALVTTSNVPPNGLYRDGLQRDRFLAAIALMEQHCEVLELATDTDYRLRTLERAEIYHIPVDAKGELQLNQSFKQLAPAALLQPCSVEVNERMLAAKGEGEGVAWFEFSELCESARAKDDYIELAREFHTILLSGVPVFSQDDGDAARRFVNLIDEFYDRSVKLIVTAAAEPENLYEGQRLAFEFERTASRLHEMRTHDYLAQPHKP